jgi:hypothetical protein
MKRVANWEAVLQAQIQLAGKKFQWGTWDCALAACDIIQALTGQDPGAPFRGKYSDEAGAKAVIGTSLGAFAANIAASLGMQEVAPRLARRGDAILIDNGTPSGSLGIVDLTGAYAACAGSNGHIRVPMRRWKRAWRVG